MKISFTTSKGNKEGERMFAVIGAQSVSELPPYDQIKEEDLAVGTSIGAEPRVARTAIDPNTHTYIHGEEGVIFEAKKKI